MIRAALITLLLAASPVAQAAPAACSNRSHPDNPFIVFDYLMVPWTVKLICNVPAEEETASIRWVYQDFGCTADSEIGQLIEAELQRAQDRVALLEGFALDAEPDLGSPYWKEVCATAEAARLLRFALRAAHEERELTASEQIAVNEQTPLWAKLFELLEQGPTD